MNVSFRNEGKVKTFSDKRKLGEFVDQQAYPKRMAKGNSLNKQIIKEGILEYQWERKKIEIVKIEGNAVVIFFFLVFKLYHSADTKMIIREYILFPYVFL